MRKISLIAALLMLSAPAAATEPLSMVSQSDGSPVPAVIESSFLYGMAHGLVTANNVLIIDGKQPLFCGSPGELEQEELRALIDTKLEGPHKPELFVVAAIDALQEKYPCPAP